MRALTFNTLVLIHGNMTHSNHHIFKKEMKRLENIWRKDKDDFKAALKELGL